MIKGDLTVGEIAVKLGYASPYEFSAQFKRFLGISPHYYRSGASLEGRNSQ